MKVIKSLENSGISLKGITRKITNQKGGFLNSIWPLMRAGLPLQKSVLIPIAKNVLLPFASSVKMSAGDAAIPKKIYVLSTTALIILDEEINDIMKIVKSLKESNLLIKGISKTINNDNKEQKKISFNAIRNISC